MARYPAHHIKILIEKAAEAAGTDTSFQGMADLSDCIDQQVDGVELSQKYLRERYKAVSDRPNDLIGINPEYANRLAEYLGHKNFREFRDDHGLETHETLEEVQSNQPEKSGMFVTHAQTIDNNLNVHTVQGNLVIGNTKPSRK